MLYEGVGKIKCSKIDEAIFKMVLIIDRGISDLYFHLIPTYYYVQRQKYHPHITVVRNEIVPDKELFWSYNNKKIKFYYDNEIKNDNRYWWLNVFCDELYSIRLSLGLKKSYRLYLPPDGKDCFHTTIGNMKRKLVLNIK